jgi:hypothetical protein
MKVVWFGKYEGELSQRSGCALMELGVKCKEFGKYVDDIHLTVEGKAYIGQKIIETVKETRHETR